MLENERFLNFKRFYLLGAIVVSLSIPFITFTYETNEPVEIVVTETLPNEVANQAVVESTFWELYGFQVLTALYIIGFTVFLIRFLRNLRKILNQANKNEKFSEYNYIFVLLRKKLDPHSFLNFIFLNRSEFKSNKISNSVLEHEKAHVDQKHSLDLIFIELIQIIFWFNPVFYFIKKSIKLNHEFLADKQVLEGETSALDYSNILYQYSSGNFESSLSSSMSHSLIKKRIIMITKEFSLKRLLLRLAVFLPVSALCLYLFNDEIIAKPSERLISPNSEIITEVQKTNVIRVRVVEEDIWLNGRSVKLMNFSNSLDKITSNWSKSEMKKPGFDIDFENSTTEFINKLNAEYKKSELAQVSGQEFLAPRPPAPAGNVPPPPPPARMGDENAPPPPPPAPEEPVVIEVVEDVPSVSQDVEVIEVIDDDRMELERQRAQMHKKREELMEKRRELRTNEKLSQKERKKAQADIERKQEEIQLKMEQVRAEHEKLRERHVAIAKEHKEMRTPPPPPPPPNPEEVISEIEAKGGSFYYNGKKVTADQIRKVVNNKDNIQIKVTQKNDSPGKIEVNDNKG